MHSTKRTGWLCPSLVAYLVFYGLFLAKYARKLPYPTIATLGPVSFAVFVILFLAIGREVMSSGRGAAAKRPANETGGNLRHPALLFSAIFYSGIFLYGLAYGYSQLGKLSTVSIVVGELVNTGMLIAVLNSLRKAYLQKR
jgi:hypothetical protein